MHRYTSLIWDSEKKTLLGKNGVTWLSIFLGTFVVLLGLGVLVQCIREVRKGRQEADARLRKELMEKRQSFGALANTLNPAKQVNKYTGIPLVPSTTTFSVINERLNKTLELSLTNEFENFEYPKERRKKKSVNFENSKKKSAKSSLYKGTAKNSNKPSKRGYMTDLNEKVSLEATFKQMFFSRTSKSTSVAKKEELAEKLCSNYALGGIHNCHIFNNVSQQKKDASSGFVFRYKRI